MSGARGSLVDWLLDQGLLRGPFPYVDYWASVLRLEGVAPESRVRDGLVDPSLFRLGLDRPDLEIPRLRYYLPLFLIGPLLLPFRFFRRLGRYRIRFRSEVAEEVLAALKTYRLDLAPAGAGRVDVAAGDRRLAAGVLDPHAVSGFCSLFYAAYKLPLASLLTVLYIGLAAAVLAAMDLLGTVTVPLLIATSPLVVLLVYIVFRDWVTAFLGAAPVLVATYMAELLRLDLSRTWGSLAAGLGVLVLCYVVIDWFFMPRPVPPVLLLYTADGPAHPYAREGDSPYWLEGRVYWVWRYLMLTPAELNKLWERDWERVELWIRADGPEAGALEWVVTDLHFRELWIPYEALGSGAGLGELRAKAVRAARTPAAGLWLLEVDANLIFHSPFFRAISFLPEEGGVPHRRVLHLMRALWKHARDDEVGDFVRALARIRMRDGSGVLDDVPEAFAHLAARHLLAQPWSHWRYPYGAATGRERRLYESPVPRPPPPAADPALQIKANPALIAGAPDRKRGPAAAGRDDRPAHARPAPEAHGSPEGLLEEGSKRDIP